MCHPGAPASNFLTVACAQEGLGCLSWEWGLHLWRYTKQIKTNEKFWETRSASCCPSLSGAVQPNFLPGQCVTVAGHVLSNVLVLHFLSLFLALAFFLYPSPSSLATSPVSWLPMISCIFTMSNNGSGSVYLSYQAGNSDTGHAEASLEPQPFARRGRASWKCMNSTLQKNQGHEKQETIEKLSQTRWE